MGKMQKTFITWIIVFALGFSMFICSFGTVLFQEGNPLPLIISAWKLQVSDSEYVQFSQSDKRSRYLSLNTGNRRYDVVKEFMKSEGWTYEEQMGAGLIFSKDGIEAIVETRQYTGHFIIWDVQHALISSVEDT